MKYQKRTKGNNILEFCGQKGNIKGIFTPQVRKESKKNNIRNIISGKSILLMLILLFFRPILSEYPNITLKVPKGESQLIIYPDYLTYLKEVYINEKKTNRF